MIMVMWKIQEGLKYEEHTHRKRERERENEVTVNLHGSTPSESAEYSFINHGVDDFMYEK